ncbi:hypothetical protein Y1Q_0012292 [Alligator mississippiensis]|uniref:Uncharacterized protein n=1 Tax=Alligator mississippiensis TaxID=8496 RepID=A0A151M4N3_ALLMI|nr:hypothetical protein Y1Q_0012292 [Alligator mississippiensis]
MEQGEEELETASRSLGSPPSLTAPDPPDGASQEEPGQATDAPETSVTHSSTELTQRCQAGDPGHSLDQLLQDPAYRHLLKQHERACKAAVPLPLLRLMQEEALVILGETLKDYRRSLARGHPLVSAVEQRLQELRGRLGPPQPRAVPPPAPQPPAPPSNKALSP